MFGNSAVLGVLGLALFAGILEVIPRIGLVSERYLPPFSRMVRALVDALGTDAFWDAFGHTAQGWGLGLAIAVGAGTAAGFLIGTVPGLKVATASTVEFLRPIPSVALIPVAVLLYGSTLRSTLLLVVYACFWQVLIQVLAGVADVDPVARETVRTFRLGRYARFRYLLLPSALPYLMTGVRLAASVALIVAITAELTVGTPGLGKEIGLAQEGGAIPEMYALVLVTGLFGVAVNIAMRRIERLVLAWHPSVRSEAPV